MHDLARLNVAQSLLGVFWGVWFAQFSHSVLNARSSNSIGTTQLHGLYIVGALAALLGLTGLLWVVRIVSDRLLAPANVRRQGDTVRDLLLLLFSFGMIGGVAAGVPVGSYFLFQGISAAEVTISAAVLPAWLGFVLLLSLIGVAASHD